jgi:peptidoglycan/xylan/chitin deacetylase (PgdA/CDA1 family)
MQSDSKNARPRVVVTTSWDDDASSGLDIAHLLGERRLPGTFYVPTGQLGEVSRFTRRDLVALAGDGFEIGGHTVSHRILTQLNAADLTREVGDCKKTLEQILGREVATFCYPRGRFNSAVVREVERAGYRGARTTRMLCTGTDFSAIKMPTTIQAFPHGRANYVRNAARLNGAAELAKSSFDLLFFESWLALGKKLFDRVLAQGGIWHLYGHPWELENLNLWPQVKEMFDYVARREGVTYLTNAQLLSGTDLKSGDATTASLAHTA